MSRETIRLEAQGHILSFDRESGRLVSFRNKASLNQEFIDSCGEHPVFVLQYLNAQRQYCQVTSADAGEVRIEAADDRGTAAITMSFLKVGGLDLELTATVNASKADLYSHWSISLKNAAALEVVSIQFPFIVVRYDLGTKSGTRQLLMAEGSGRLLENPRPWSMGIGPDHPSTWNIGSAHYPGQSVAQFMAYYNDLGGLYVACHDNQANTKLFRTPHRDPGLRLGIAHVGDWPTEGQRKLEYDVVLAGFKGDWYNAAEMYRSWSLQQPWATPLHKRKDVPAWLLKSPVHITLRMQGELDAGPVFPIKEFLPYKKTIPLLEKLAARVEAPLAVIIMAWERGGPRVYPDCFPPIGGDESVTYFAKIARQRGWHVGSFCNGTRWVIEHRWAKYDGSKYLQEHQGSPSFCRTADGQFWKDDWDANWRPSFRQCMGTEMTRQMAADFVKRLIGWGLESIQFFDQNFCAQTFPCFAGDHEHPPIPGKWMALAMGQMMEVFRDVAAQAGQNGVIQSVECPCNETCLPLFQQCDVRVEPPGFCNERKFVPLYHYLYHECIIMHGMMGFGSEPYHLPIRNAYNLVLGENVGAVMIGDGTLLNKDTDNWAPWENPVGNNDDSLEMLRTAVALRRGPGKDFLVFGRMQRPAEVRGIKTVTWERKNGPMNRVPAIFHAAWQAPNGQLGIVLANWTSQRQAVRVVDKRLTKSMELSISAGKLTQKTIQVQRKNLAVTLPPLSCALVRIFHADVRCGDGVGLG